jgi:hypothetical protein
LRAGERVRFRKISRDEFESLRNENSHPEQSEGSHRRSSRHTRESA